MGEQEYQRYLIQCLFSHRDYFTEEKILSFKEFKNTRTPKERGGEK